MGLWMGLGLDLNMNGSASLGGGGSGSKLYVSDSFNRPDNNTTLGNADTGQTWSTPSAVWGIESNQAKWVSGSSRAIIDTGVSDNVRVSVVYAVVSSPMRLIFRYTDSSNEWYVDIGAASVSVLKREAGAITSVIGISTTTVVNGDVISITLKGPVITLFVNGVALGTTTSSFNQTATICGLNTNANATQRYDNFKVESLPAVIPPIVSDSFNRADNASSLGNADTGQAWSTIASAVYGIETNRARCFSGTGGAIVNTGVSDMVSISCIWSVVAQNMRLNFRYSDASNEWFVNNDSGTAYFLVKRAANSATVMISTTQTPVNGDKVEIRLSGSNISLYVNGLLVGSVSDSFNQSATICGMSAAGSTVARFDDLTVRGI